MIIVILIIIVSAAFVVWCAWNSPSGYEDEQGFHEGEEIDG